MDGRSSGAGGKVLAALVSGRGLRLELIHGGRSARLTNWVLTGTSLTRTVSAKSGSGRENGSLGRRGLARIAYSCGSSQHAVNGQGRRLLMSASEGVSRWRRERSDLGRGIKASRGRGATE